MKDFRCGRWMYFVHFCVSAACSFLSSSSSSCCSASGQRRLCWQRVHCSPGSWGALCRKSAEPQCVPKSTLWPTWRNEGTDLGTVLQKAAIFVSGNIYMCWRTFSNLSPQGEIPCSLCYVAIAGQCRAVLCFSSVAVHWICWLFHLINHSYVYLASFLDLL